MLALANLTPSEAEFLRVWIRDTLRQCRQGERWAGYVVDKNAGLLRLSEGVVSEQRDDLSRLCRTIGWAVEELPPTKVLASVDTLAPRLVEEVASLDDGLAAMCRVLRLRFGAKGKVIVDLSSGTCRFKSKKGRTTHGKVSV